ncbi:uncharacterized protein LOC121763321 [Salvia splendens]|uniref:uncharacterized protein LOC121763321 n=1 Tax=Salvia splendens TaxID=180675 RepID=UPI001C2609B7|nr:uncharacterized protein LOC121763321 [Salvia splendens]XP_042015254.1 uncharacterized protein LOC121763321 [Salvia splendens]XP_042015255.1 uncharacterized protein LOC121763321 [Salvia splendens]
MSGGEGRKLSNQDIQLVKNRIEQCLQQYMNKKEVINDLIVQGNVEPCITELVWQRLEDENQDFFKAYYLKLLVKEQIMEFNRLLSEQVDLMRRTGLNGIDPYLPSNGSHVSPSQHISTTCPTQNIRPVKTENMQQENVFNNCGSAIQSCLQGAMNGPGLSRKIDVSPNLLLSQNADMGLSQMLNGKSVKTGAGYAGSSPFAFSPPSNFLESRPLMGDASVSSFSSVDSNAQHLNETLMDGDTSSFGFLAQIPQSFSELPADFSTNSDLLESYCGPPFLPGDANNFANPHGDAENLDPESESLRFHCFGSE